MAKRIVVLSGFLVFMDPALAFVVLACARTSLINIVSFVVFECPLTISPLGISPITISIVTISPIFIVSIQGHPFALFPGRGVGVPEKARA